MDWLIEKMEQWQSYPAIVSNDLEFSYKDVLAGRKNGQLNWKHKACDLEPS